VKSSATTRRYVGTIRTTDSATTEDSAAKRFVWNYYNRVQRFLTRDYTGDWTYDTATWRQTNADSANQLEFVVGDAGVLAAVQDAGQMLAYSTANYASHYRAIGVDSTSAPSGHQSRRNNMNNNLFADLRAEWVGHPGLGYHFLASLEYGDAGGGALNPRTVTMFGRIDG